MSARCGSPAWRSPPARTRCRSSTSWSLRPSETRHAPRLDRVGGQLRQAYRLLEAEMPEAEGGLIGRRPMQADLEAVVAWEFTHHILAELSPEHVPGPTEHPRVAELSARAEALPAFRNAPTL